MKIGKENGVCEIGKFAKGGGTNVRWKGIKRGRWGCKIAKGKWRGKKKERKSEKRKRNRYLVIVGVAVGWS